MATRRKSILNHSVGLDTSAQVYPVRLDATLTMTNPQDQEGIMFEFPTGSDITIEGEFDVPQEYSSTPNLYAKFIIDGTPSGTVGLTAQPLPLNDSESTDTAYETEDTTSNGTWTGYADEDYWFVTVTFTPSSVNAGETMKWRFGRDDSVDTTTFNLILMDLFFQYDDGT